VNSNTKVLMKLFMWLIILFLPIFEVLGSDWPMWRYDAGRTAYSPETLSEELNIQWTRKYTSRDPVWDDPLNRDLMQYDRIFEPIVMGKCLYIGFNDRDKIAAIDTETGKQKWQFFTEGPVRLPPVGWNDRIYITSDDGYLYCLSADKGELLWKFRGGPNNRKLLGNKRMISMWPARGGVVIDDGVLYFAASIWPWMGTFIYALDAETGEIVWRNDDTNADYIMQPHNYTAYAGIAPQGMLVLSGNRLLIPGGRSVPACFDKQTGKQLYYHLGAQNKTGGAFVCANDSFYFYHHRDRVVNLCNISDGSFVQRAIGTYPALGKDCYYFSGASISARLVERPDSLLWELDVDASGDLIVAGSHLIAGGENCITALELSETHEEPKLLWSKQIDGKVGRLLAADGKLFAVTEDGRITTFGKESEKTKEYPNNNTDWKPSKEIAALANSILETTDVRDGYALMYGAKKGDLAAALIQQSDVNLVVVEPDAKKIDKLRHRYDEMGVYGKRLHVIQGTPESVQLSNYFASLTILWDVDASALLANNVSFAKLRGSIRPYGGVLWAPAAKNHFDQIQNIVHKVKLDISYRQKCIVITHNGGLEGADNWTHQYGDIANTVKSDDQLVKMPLGLLWFGGNSNLDVLPRHGHGPPEQVVDGRLIIQGMKSISARDVYTGRVLWKAPLDSLETFQMYYNESYADTPLNPSYNQRHIPGANGRGTNFIATNDFVYIVQNNKCKVLDITNGSTKQIFSVPSSDDEQARWAYIGVYQKNLIAGSGFARYSALVPKTDKEIAADKELSLRRRTDNRDKENYDLAASRSLAIMDRYTGEVKWQIDARHGFIHNSIIVADGRLYCLDKLPAFTENKMNRRGLTLPNDYRLLVIDIASGQIERHIEKDVFGSWLSYSKKHKVILQATRPSGDMLRGEKGERMAVYDAVSMAPLWDQQIKYSNPPIMHNDRIITEHVAYNLLTGEQDQRTDPITNEIIPWTYTRTKGCNYSIASEHMLSFRSSTAAFFDLTDNGGTGHFGGFKSGCTSNLIAANGVLNAPDYTRTCQCSFQNQTSLALVHMPGVEYWTESDFKWSGKPVRQVGINFGAPGDRRADNGTLWLEYPGIGGPSPDISVEIEGNDLHYIRRHSWFLENSDNLPWVTASAVTGISNLTITLNADSIVSDSTFTVNFYFAELEDKEIGERVFDVYVQDQEALTGFDVAKEAGGTMRGIVKTFSGISVEDTLSIRFKPSSTVSESVPMLSGIEILIEE
jgi:outer membrane protein assembly factor BamB